MVDRIPSTEQSFYKISTDLDSISGSVDGLEEAIATLSEGIEALDATVEIIETALETVVTAVETQGETLEQILVATTGPEPLQLESGEMLLPGGPDEAFIPVIFSGVTQDVDGWMTIDDYETVSMVAQVFPDSYQVNADAVPTEFDYTVSNYSQFREAIINAAPGSKIFVEPGTYMLEEEIVIDKSLYIYGAGETTLFQIGVDSSSASFPSTTAFSIKASNVKLQDFKLVIFGRSSVPNSSVPGTNRGICPFIAGIVETVAYSFFTGPMVYKVGDTSGITAGTEVVSKTKIENIEIVNINVDFGFITNLSRVFYVENFRMQGCTVTWNLSNNQNPVASAISAPHGDFLFQDNSFHLVLDNPSDPYAGGLPFRIQYTMNDLTSTAGNLEYPAIRGQSTRFTVRNCAFDFDNLVLISFGGPIGAGDPFDPETGIEICIEGCTYTVRSQDPFNTTPAANFSPGAVYHGTSILMFPFYYNPTWALHYKCDYILDMFKSITFKDNNITGGERGLIFVRHLINSGSGHRYVSKYVGETAPIPLRSASPLPIHKSGNTINNIYPLKSRELASAGEPEWRPLHNVFGDADRTLVTTRAQFDPVNTDPATIAVIDGDPVPGVQPPVDITLAGQGSFEVKTEYRLVEDGLALNFVPETSIDILTETEKEVINPRIPAVLLGVLQIRFLVRAVNRLGDSLLKLFGTIR